MKIDDMIPTKSNFLKQDDVGENGKNLTIASFEQMDVGTENEKETKFCLVWLQKDWKPMILNRENGNRLKLIAKTDDTDQMIGLTINVFADKFVSFGGKTTGGLRIRAAASVQPRPQTRPAQKPPTRQAQVPAVDPNDELPPLAAYDDDSSPPY